MPPRKTTDQTPADDQPPVDGVEPLEATPDPAPVGFDEPVYDDDRTAADEQQAKARTRGAGPQTVDGYEPPAPPARGDKPLGYHDDEFSLKTGPTSPSIVDQQALTALAEHAPQDELDDLPTGGVRRTDT